MQYAVYVISIGCLYDVIGRYIGMSMHSYVILKGSYWITLGFVVYV